MKNLNRLQRPFLFALLLLIPWQWCERSVWSQAKDSNQSSATTDTLPQLVVRLGHAGAVKHMAFSSDGRLVVTAGEDKQVILWSVSTARQIRRFEGEIEASSLEFAPKGSTLLIDGELWSADTGKEIFANASGAKFSPDGRFLLTPGQAGIELRSALTGEVIRSLGEHKGYKTFSFSPDSRFVLINHADKSASLVNVETGQDSGHFAGDEARFSPNGAFVIANSNGTVLWNVASRKEERRFEGEAANVSLNGQLIITADAKGSVLKEISSGAEVRRFTGRSPKFSPDDRLVVTRDERGPAIFELATGRELYHFDTIVDGVDGVTFSSNGRFFLTRGDDSHSDERVSVWDARKMRASREFDPDNFTSAIFSPDGSYVLTGDQNPVAHLWDSATGLEVRKFEGDAPIVTAVRFVKEGQFLEANTARLATQASSENPTLKTLAAAASGWEIATGQQLRYYQALPDTVYSAAASPDGRFAVTGGEQTAHLWEVAGGKEARVFQGHTGPIVSVVFSFDGRTILTASKDGTARLWETATGSELQRFNGHANELVGAAMSKDGRVVLTGSHDGTARLWDARSGQELRQFGERESGVVSMVLSIALSADGRFALTGNLETSNLNAKREVRIIHSASLWETATGKELRLPHPDAVLSVAFSPDNSSILTGCLDTNVRLWKLADGTLVRTLQHRMSTGISVAFSPNGQFFLTSGLDRALPDKQSLGFEACLWNAATGQVVKTFANKKTNDLRSVLFTSAAAFSGDGHSITTVTFNLTDPKEILAPGRPQNAMSGFAQVWNADTGKELARFGREAGDPQSIKFSPDGSTVIVHRVDQNSLQIMNARTGQELRSLEPGPDSFIFDVAYSPDGRLILAGTTGGCYLWEAQTGKLLQHFSEFSSKQLAWDADITSVRFSPDDQVVSIVVDGKVFVCDVQTGGFLKLNPAPAHELPPTKIPLEMAFSADAKFMALVGDAGTLSLVNFVTGEQPLEFKGHTKKITLVAYSANEKYIASASEDQTVRLWETASAKQLQVFPQTDPVSIVAFAPDGRSLLTAGNRIMRLWDTNTGKMLRELPQAEAVTSAALSKNGRLIITGGKSGNIYLRNALTGAALRTLKGHTAKVTTLAFTPDSRFLVSSGDDKSVRLWDVAGGAEVPRFAAQKRNVTSMSLSANGNWIVTSGEDKVVRLLDLSNGHEVRQLTTRGDVVNSVAFSPDGRFVLTGNMAIRLSQGTSGESSDDEAMTGNARLWNLSTKQVQKRFGKKEIIQVDFSPNGKFMLTATGDILKPGLKSIDEVEIRETETGKLVRSFDFSDREGTLSAAMSPDGRLLLTGTIHDADDNKGEPARLLGTDSKGEEVEKANFLGHSGMVMSVAYSPDGRFVVTGSLDGTIGVWNPTTGAQICRLISFSDGTWVVVDKDGRFDTNNLEEIKGLQWVMADDPLMALPLEIFMRPFYEPRLLPRLLANDDFIEAPPLADLNRVQPNVTITEVKKDGPDTAAVTVEVENVSRTYQREQNPTVQSGAKDLRLFRDGQLVSYRDGNLLDQKQSATRGCEPLSGTTKKCRTVFDHIRLPRQEGVKDVEFSAYAFNTSDVKSETFRYPFLFTPDLPPRKGRVYLITVGVSSYENPAWNLQFAANDAHLVHDTVAAKLRATGEYDDVVEVLLTSEERLVNGERVIEKKATKENFRKVLRLLAGEKPGTDDIKDIPNAQKILKANPEDLVLIFYSSHGYRDTERFYLFPYDTGAGVGRDPITVVPHAISSDDLYHWLRDVDAGDLVLVIDACYAAAVTGKEFKPGPMGSRGMGQLAYDKGMRILAATQPDTTAAEVNDVGQQRKIQHGLLTYALVEDGLIEKKVSADGEGKILLSEWLEYGVKDVPALYQEIIACLRSQQCAPSSKGDGTTVRFISKGEGDSTVQQPTLFDFTRKIRRKRRLLIDKISLNRPSK